jgi:hypothetical protein
MDPLQYVPDFGKYAVIPTISPKGNFKNFPSPRFLK